LRLPHGRYAFRGDANFGPRRPIISHSEGSPQYLRLQSPLFRSRYAAVDLVIQSVEQFALTIRIGSRAEYRLDLIGMTFEQAIGHRDGPADALVGEVSPGPKVSAPAHLEIRRHWPFDPRRSWRFVLRDQFNGDRAHEHEVRRSKTVRAKQAVPAVLVELGGRLNLRRRPIVQIEQAPCSFGVLIDQASYHPRESARTVRQPEIEPAEGGRWPFALGKGGRGRPCQRHGDGRAKA